MAKQEFREWFGRITLYNIYNMKKMKKDSFDFIYENAQRFLFNYNINIYCGFADGTAFIVATDCYNKNSNITISVPYADIESSITKNSKYILHNKAKLIKYIKKILITLFMEMSV